MKRLAIGILAAACLTGCYTIEYTFRNLDSDSVRMTSVPGDYEGHYKEAETVPFLLGGLIPLGKPDPAKYLRKYIGNGRKISSLRTTAEMSFVDGVLSYVTMGIYTPLTITYEWDVVKERLAKRADPAANTNANTNTNTIIINPGQAAPIGQIAPAAGVVTPQAIVNPVITSIAASPPAIRAGQRAAVSVEAYTSTGRPLTYSWSSTAGLLSATSGRLIFWSAPDQPGAYAVIVSVTDGAGGQAVGTVNIAVSP